MKHIIKYIAAFSTPSTEPSSLWWYKDRSRLPVDPRLTPDQKRLVSEHIENCKRIASEDRPENIRDSELSWHRAHDEFVKAMVSKMTSEQRSKAKEIPAANKSETWIRHEAQRILGLPDPLDEAFEPEWIPE